MLTVKEAIELFADGSYLIIDTNHMRHDGTKRIEGSIVKMTEVSETDAYLTLMDGEGFEEDIWVSEVVNIQA